MRSGSEMSLPVGGDQRLNKRMKSQLASKPSDAGRIDMHGRWVDGADPQTPHLCVNCQYDTIAEQPSVHTECFKASGLRQSIKHVSSGCSLDSMLGAPGPHTLLC